MPKEHMQASGDSACTPTWRLIGLSNQVLAGLIWVAQIVSRVISPVMRATTSREPPSIGLQLVRDCSLCLRLKTAQKPQALYNIVFGPQNLN